MPGLSPTADSEPPMGRAERSRAPRWSRVDRVLEVVSTAIAEVCAWLIGAMVLLMLLAVSLQVVARYWIGSFVGGPEELARLSMVMMVFISLPVLVRYSEDIRLDVAAELIPSRRVRDWLVSAALVLELVFFIILTVLAYEFVAQLARSSQQTPALGIKLFWSRLPILVGSALATIVCTCVVVRHLLSVSDLDENDPETVGAL